MKCEKCGIEVQGNFCPNCGTKIVEEENVKVREKIEKEYIFSADRFSHDLPYKVEVAENTLRVSRVLKVMGAELDENNIEQTQIQDIQDIKISTVLSTRYATGLVFCTGLLAVLPPQMDFASTFIMFLAFWAIAFIGGFVNKKVEIISNNNSIIVYSNSKSKEQLKAFLEDIKVNSYFNGAISKNRSKKQTGVTMFVCICMVISLIRVVTNDDGVMEYVQNYEIEDNLTIKEVVEDMWKNGEWDSFVADDSDENYKRVVEYKVDDDNLIQFRLKDDTTKFEEWGIYMEIDGQRISDQNIDDFFY